MNKKFWIRWMSILLICVAYYVIVLYFDLVFAVNSSETVKPGVGFHTLSANVVRYGAI